MAQIIIFICCDWFKF